MSRTMPLPTAPGRSLCLLALALCFLRLLAATDGNGDPCATQCSLVGMDLFKEMVKNAGGGRKGRPKGDVKEQVCAAMMRYDSAEFTKDNVEVSRVGWEL